ncbi:hypothetical protein Cgig2_006916 [Carnegiea gigantea]|uniref:CCHC-type domain-containing protein n=1 Tax=Carnegiea gigantea TaxID=171969 RepID=A0A9Q1JM00_9CARY|nr:hypothetical protein Cgig2_006916 [Carnegiea gigantea]
MIIAWIQNSVTDSIEKSVLFLNSAREIWVQLKQRFSLSNGSRKYKINKEIYECGNKGHVKEKCWLVIGYPQWHPKAKKFPQKRDNKVQAYKGKTQGFNDSADHGQNMHLASDTSVPHGVEDAASEQEHSHQQPLTVPSTSVPGTRRPVRQTKKP